MLLFFPIIFGTPLLGVLWLFWADRRLRHLKNPRRWRIAAGIFAATMLGGFIWVLLARRLHIAAMPPTPILAAVYIWHLLVLPLTLLSAIVAGLVMGLRNIIGKLRGNRRENRQVPQDVLPSRRQV